MRYAALLLLVATLAMGQQWEIERVDTVGWGYGVQMRRYADGRLFLCYVDSATGQVRLAWKGDTWRREDIPQPMPAKEGEPRFAFAPDGSIGVTYSGRSGSWLSLRQDTAWVHTPLPESTYVEKWTMPITFDSASRPVLAVNFDPYGSGGWVMALGLLRLTDTLWEFTDTLDLGPRGPVYDVSGFGNRGGARLWGTYTTFVYDVAYWYMDIRWFEWQNGWQFGTWFGGVGANVGGDRGAVDRHGAVHASYSGSDTTGRSGFFLDYDVIRSERPQASALAIDSLDRPLVAYVLGSALKFCYRDNRGWHFFDVGADGVMSLDILPGPNGQPLIAYATNDGVFLARGVNVTGVGEDKERGVSRAHGRALIVRNMLYIPAPPSPFLPGEEQRVSVSVLLDATGRKVMDLHAGANNVSHLACGIYLVRVENAGFRLVFIR